MALNLVLLIALTITAVASVMKTRLVKAAILLAITSIILTILMFRLGSPLAAVFELSVCAGLITVVFMSTISLTKPLSTEEEAERRQNMARRYSSLPVLVLVAAVILIAVTLPTNFSLPQAASPSDVRDVLWNERQLDLLGQIVVIIAGVFGVVVLFKDKRQNVTETDAALSQDRLAVTFRENSLEREFVDPQFARQQFGGEQVVKQDSELVQK